MLNHNRPTNLMKVIVAFGLALIALLALLWPMSVIAAVDNDRQMPESILPASPLAAVTNVSCSVGDLINQISAANSGDTLVLSVGCVYNLTTTHTADPDGYGPIGLPKIDKTLIILGNGATIRRSTNSKYRLFYVTDNGDLTLDSLTLRDGIAQGGNGGNNTYGGDGGGGAGLGGAVFNRGDLTILRSTLSSNQAIGGNGSVGGSAWASWNGSSGGDMGGDGGGGGGGGGRRWQNGDGNNGGDGGFGAGGGGGGRGYDNGGDGGYGGFGGGGGGGGTVESYSGARRGKGRSGGFGGGNGSNGGQTWAAHGGNGGGGGGMGGAIFNYAGTVTIFNSTLSANTVQGGNNGGKGFGGALFNLDGTVVVSNTTLAANTLSGSADGGAIYNYQDNSTASLTLVNSILADTQGNSSNDCRNNGGTVNAPIENRNLIDNNIGCGSPVSGANPTLADLGDYGGNTQTMPLLVGSPAIDAGDNATCATTDQRGKPRYGTCDLGAVEFQGLTIIGSSGSGQTQSIYFDFDEPLSLTVTLNDTDDVIAGSTVDWSAPATGAGLDSANQSSAIDGNGQTVLTATANGTAGTYVVTATIRGQPATAIYTLTNVKRIPDMAAYCPGGVGDSDKLISAINNANSDLVVDTITLPANCVYTLTTSYEAGSGLPIVDTSVIIDGNGSTIIRDSGAGNFRLFFVDSAGDLTLNDITLANGKTGQGGAIFNRGHLSLQDSILTGNESTDNNGNQGGGGLMTNGGQVTVLNTVFMNNKAQRGGAIFASAGVVDISNTAFLTNTGTRYGGAIYRKSGGSFSLNSSLFSGNAANSDNGGGIFNDTSGLTVENSTFFNNSARNGGGILHGNSTLFVSNSTFSDNTAGQRGGGIAVSHSKILTLTNSTLVSNTAYITGGGIYNDNNGVSYLYNTLIAHSISGNDCAVNTSGTVYAYTNTTNLIADGSCDAQLSGDPLVSPLGDNGGESAEGWLLLTHALLNGSPAIDAGDSAVCASVLVNNQDERGAGRPVGSGCDIGAFEVGPFIELSKSVTPFDPQKPLTYTLVLANHGSMADSAVLLTDTLPTDLDFGGWVTQPSGASQANDQITWSGALAAGEVITFAFITNLTAGFNTSITNIAEFNSTYQTGSDQVTLSTEVVDIAITKQVNSDSPFPGDSITYTLAFSNVGSVIASGVTISDSVPSQILGVSAEWRGDSGVTITHTSGTTYAWDVGNLEAGQGGLITITGYLSSSGQTISDHFTNTAIINTTHNDEITSNNSASVGVEISCADNYTVTNTNEDGAGSLNFGLDVICPGGTIGFAADTTFYLTSTIFINKNVAIDGGYHKITFSGDTGNDGSRNVRPFLIGPGGVVTLSHLSVVSGTADAGGAILNGGGQLTLEASALIDNQSTGLDAFMGGGGLQNDGTATLINTTVARNKDTASGVGGGIHSGVGSTLNLLHVTLAENEAGVGGGLYLEGTLYLANTLIANNVGLSQTIGSDCYNDSGTVAINSTSLIEQNNSCGTPFLTSDPLLAPLGDYGSNTSLYALYMGSPAINQVVVNAVTTDQRGLTRTGSHDIGAFESQGFLLTITGGNNQSTEVGTTFALPLQVHLEPTFEFEPIGPHGVISFTAIPNPFSGAGLATSSFALPTIATSPQTLSVTVTANITAGNYTVEPSTTGVNGFPFFLTNIDSGPGGVSNDLDLWLKADAGTSTTADGGNVSSWTEQSSNGWTANNITNTIPIYNRNALNFNPAVTFGSAGSASELSFGSNYITSTVANGNNGLTIFAVVDPTSNISGSNYLVDVGLPTFRGYGLSYSAEWFGSYTPQDGGINSTAIDGIHIAGDAPALLTHRTLFGTGNTFYLNGFQAGIINHTLLSSLDDSTINFSSTHQEISGPLTIGRAANVMLPAPGGTDERYFRGDIAEVLIYGNYLEDADHKKVESYLAWKYGLTMIDGLDGISYTHSLGTVVWNADSNSSYHNDVAGIGRDDGSIHSQLKSRSVNTDSIVTIGHGNDLSNPSAFAIDHSFLFWGNNNATVSLSQTVINNQKYEWLTRIWRVQESGMLADTSIAFDLSGLGLTYNADQVALLLDTDTDFSNATLHTTGRSINGDVITFSNVNFSNGDYFSLVLKGFPDVAIAKAVSPATAEPGELVTYILTFSNSGDDVATGIVITDFIPISVTVQNVASNSAQVITRTSTQTAEVFEISALSPGDSGVITLTAQVSNSLSAGIFTNTVTVATTSSDTNADNNSAEAGLTISNIAPVVVPVAPQTIAETETLTFTVMASDANGDSLTFGLYKPETGMSIDSNGVFTWTPTEAQGTGATYLGTSIVVTDSGGLTGTAVIMVTVNEVNIAPVLAAIGNKNIPANDLFVLNLSATDADRPNNSLTYSISGAPSGANLVGNTFSWTPSSSQSPGDYPITFSVSDNGSPVLTDSETITISVYNVPNVNVIESNGSTILAEETLTDTYQVVLNTQPTDIVTVIINSDSQVNTSESSLIFGAGNWNITRTVIVTAVNDSLYAGPRSSTITHTASSNDSDYDSISADLLIDGVTANISDDAEDLPTIAVSDITVDEGAGTANVSVTLTGQSAFAAGVDYSISDGTATGGGVDYSASNDTLTWTANTAGTKAISVTITEDSLDETDETVIISLSNAISAAIVDASGVLTITDNDVAPNLSITKTVEISGNGPAIPGDPITYTIVISNSGGGAEGTTVQDTLPAGISGTDLDWTGTVTAYKSITFTINATISNIAANYMATITNTAAFTYGLNTDQAMASFTTIGDITPPTFTIGSLITPTNGVMLTNARPTFDWRDATDSQSGVISYTLLITGPNGVQMASATQSTYTPSADLVSGSYTWTVRAHDALGNASDYVAPPATFSLREVPGVIITEPGGSTEVAERGASDTYQVVLNAQPTANVTITLITDSQVNVSPDSLPFTPLDWETAQTVTVSAIDDAVYEGVHSGLISHTAASVDAGYTGIAIAGLTATISDNDPAPLTYTLSVNIVGSGSVSPTGGSYLSGTVVSLSATPDADWQFDGWSGDLSGATNPIDVTMGADKTITATFSEVITPPTPISYTLSVNMVGSGTVTPTSGSYLSGTIVSLSATPDAGWQFAGWSGDLSGTTNPLDVTLDSDKIITATFSEIGDGQNIFLPIVLK